MIVLKKQLKTEAIFLLKNQLRKQLQKRNDIDALAEKHNVKGQVGHVERFNPAFTAVSDKMNQSDVYRDPSISRI